MTGRWLIVGVTSLVVVGGGAFLFGIATSDSEDAVASLESLEDRGVIHLEDDHVFLVFNDGKPIALSDDAQHVGDRVEFCESSQMFESPAHGEKFDLWGLYYAGPAQRGLDRYPVRIDGDRIFVDFSRPIQGPERGDPPASEPKGRFCIAD
jgi:Rieske Fe-S protein